MAFNYARSRTVADQQIRKWGAPAKLRRASGGDRSCWALEVSLTAAERNALKNFKSRVFLISAVDLAEPPTREDALITYAGDGTTENAPLRQVAPVAPLSPGGVVVYWEIQVE